MTKAHSTPNSATQKVRAPWVWPLLFVAVAAWTTTFAIIFT